MDFRAAISLCKEQAKCNTKCFADMLDGAISQPPVACLCCLEGSKRNAAVHGLPLEADIVHLRKIIHLFNHIHPRYSPSSALVWLLLPAYLQKAIAVIRVPFDFFAGFKAIRIIHYFQHNRL